MPHICGEEIAMLMAMIPFIGIFFRRIHTWYHAKIGHKCHEKSCNDIHSEHSK